MSTVPLLPSGSRGPSRDIVDEADVQLLATLLGRPSRQRARAILRRKRLDELVQAEALGDLGLSTQECDRLRAATQLGERLLRTPSKPVRIESAQAVDRHLRPRLVHLTVETFWVLLLDVRLRLLRSVQVSSGTLTHSLVHPREVFRAAILGSAFAVICVHNHPSGDPEPSEVDLDVTRRLASAGELLGIPLHDHVVIAREGFVSLRERVSF